MALRAVCALSLLLTGSFAVEMFTPILGMKQLDVLEAALHKIVDNKMLTAVQMKAAKKVVADVEGAVAEISRKDVSKEAKALKFASAIKELSSLQSDFEAKVHSNTTAMQEKLDTLQKELAEKKKALEQEEDMLNLYKLKKQLAEKQLELDGLTEAKTRAQAQEEAKKEVASQQAMVKNLLAMAKGLTAAKPKSKTTVANAKLEAVDVPVPLKPILANLESRAHNLTEEIKVMDVSEKKKEAEMDGVAQKKVGIKLDRDAKKTKAMIKMVLGQSRRAYKQKRALKETELGELNEAVRSVEKRDVASLTRVMAKMEAETKSFQAKGNKFLV